MYKSLLGISLLFLCSTAWAVDMDAYGKRAVLAIIGEAEGEGYTGMCAVASAIRNRGTLKGVYGEHAPRVKKHLYSKKTYQMAWDAWGVSMMPSNRASIGGATHWENVKAFGKPYWASSMVETATIGSHTFFKEKR